MKKFEKIGFLGMDYRRNIKTLPEVRGPLTDLLIGLMEISWGIQYQLEVDTMDLVMIHSATLYARILNSIQASHLLAVYGLGAQSSNQCRAALECLFQLAAINKKRELFDGLMLADIRDTRTYLERYQAQLSKNNKVSQSRIEVLKQKTAKLNERINQLEAMNIQKLSKIENIAKEADMQSWYELLYRALSRGTHSSLISLQEHLQISEDSNITHFTNEPNFEDFFSNTYCCLKVLSRAIEEVYVTVKEIPPTVLADYNKQLEALKFDEHVFQRL